MPYGTHMPLNQLATVSVPEPRMISVQVWDKSMVKAVEKAIRRFQSRSVAGDRRPGCCACAFRTQRGTPQGARVKVAHKYAKRAKVAVRHVRRDGLDTVKEAREESRDFRG